MTLSLEVLILLLVRLLFFGGIAKFLLLLIVFVSVLIAIIGFVLVIHLVRFYGSDLIVSFVEFV